MDDYDKFEKAKKRSLSKAPFKVVVKNIEDVLDKRKLAGLMVTFSLVVGASVAIIGCNNGGKTNEENTIISETITYGELNYDFDLTAENIINSGDINKGIYEFCKEDEHYILGNSNINALIYVLHEKGAIKASNFDEFLSLNGYESKKDFMEDYELKDKENDNYGVKQ